MGNPFIVKDVMEGQKVDRQPSLREDFMALRENWQKGLDIN